jgi:hypothetical protein
MKEDIHLKKPISDPQQHKEKNFVKNYCHRRQRCVSNNRLANDLSGRWIEMENKENRKNEEQNELNEEELSKANGGVRVLPAINTDFLDNNSIGLMSNDKKKKKPKKIDS